MPIHPHDRAERLESEWVSQAAQELVATIMMDNSLADDGSERSHPLTEPFRDATAMKR